MTVISNEQVAAGPAIDYAGHRLIIEKPDHNGGCGDEQCCGGPTRRSYCECGQHTFTASDDDYLLEEHADHVAEAHGVEVEDIDDDRLRVTYE